MKKSISSLFNKSVLLAPMEDVTDISFRLVCRELGADVVYTEFVNSEGLVRASEKTHKKLRIVEEERPVGIQIYGSNLKSMVGAARIAEAENPDIIDINAGCWVKGVVGSGAGAGLLKDPEYLQLLVKEIVNNVDIPVTVKTRIGWDSNSIFILDVAKRLEDAGIQALTVHCRTRVMGHKGDADWSWIPKIKEVIKIPVILNGNVLTAQDVVRAFNETGADGVMIARGAIGNPWIFSEAKDLLTKGFITDSITEEKRIKFCLRHLKLAMEVKGDRRGILEHRKYYSGYLKGMYMASQTRQKLMVPMVYNEVEEILLDFLQSLRKHHLEKDNLLISSVPE
jgi:tRNA-dihydrouridine synthase B